MHFPNNRIRTKGSWLVHSSKTDIILNTQKNTEHSRTSGNLHFPSQWMVEQLLASAKSFGSQQTSMYTILLRLHTQASCSKRHEVKTLMLSLKAMFGFFSFSFWLYFFMRCMLILHTQYCRPHSTYWLNQLW